MVDSYLLEQLVAVYECGTLSAAAERLHLAQSSLSRSMQKLEAIFQVSLFDRRKNRISLNDAGRTAAECARHVLAEEQNMLERVRLLNQKKQCISVGTVAHGLAMVLIPQMESLYPQMTIRTELKDEDTLLAGLDSGAYQMIILNHAVHQTDIVCRMCGMERLYFAVPKSHRFARRKQCSFQEMNGESFLIAENVGQWVEIVRRRMPASSFFAQKGMDALHDVAQFSNMAYFATDHTLALYKNRKKESYLAIDDAEAIQQFFCCCLAMDLPRFSAWFDLLRERNRQKPEGVIT